MTFDDFESQYSLPDGEVISLHIDYCSDNNDKNSVLLTLKVKRILTKNKRENCILKLMFQDNLQINIYENFGTGSDLSDITLVKLENGCFYLSLDPYDNSGLPNNKDNFTIQSKNLTIINENGNNKIE
jgi:hypothetical protein